VSARREAPRSNALHEVVYGTARHGTAVTQDHLEKYAVKKNKNTRTNNANIDPVKGDSMTSTPALTALALIELIERHLRQPADIGERNEEFRALLADDDDDYIHADFMVDVAKELATFVIGIAARTNYPIDEFVADYRRQLLARDDDA
jgi:hypothetical protein